MATCDIPDTNPINVPCITAPIVTTPNTDCAISPIGVACPSDPDCSPFSLTSEELSSDSCLINSFVSESLNIGSANINVFKLLGIYEQGLLQDLTGSGQAISNGSIPNYPPENAFDKFITEWRSGQLGSQVLSSWLGYDFGPIRLANDRVRYGIETLIKHDVATIKLKQGCNSVNRVSQIRVERSNDGVKWFGAALLNVPDCDGMVTFNFARTVPSRWWRIRPTQFNGGPQDWWSVQALQLIDYEVTAITNVQDRIFLENRDRQYNKSAITIKGSYTPLSLQTFQSKFGMSQLFGGAETYSIEISFSDVVALLGRTVVIGDIIQLPSETQYSPTLKPILKYLEVTDIAWSTNGYTPNWIPTLQRILAQPVIASQETQDILGKLTQDVDKSGLVDIDNGDNTKAYQDVSSISQTIHADSNTNVPERGEDFADVTKLSPEVYEWAKQYKGLDIKKVDRNRNVYGIDAMPPNGLPFTQGDTYPANPKNGDYHRLTYTFINNNIPPMLYRYSSAKGRWIYLETDLRFEHKNTKPVLQEFLNSSESSVTNPHNMNVAFGTPTPSATPVQYVTATPYMTHSPSPTPSISITPTWSATPTSTPTATPISYVTAVLQDSPYAYYQLNETSGITAFDSSGNNLNGTYEGGLSLANAIVRSNAPPVVSFSGDTSEYVDINNAQGFLSSSQWTIECWASIASFNQESYAGSGYGITIVSNILDGSAESSFGLCLGIDASAPDPSHDYGIWYWPAGSQDQWSTTTYSTLNTTVYIVLTYNNGTLTYYINGNNAGTITGVESALASSTGDPLTIGRQCWISGELNGAISDVALYTTALSADRVALHYAAGST